MEMQINFIFFFFFGFFKPTLIHLVPLLCTFWCEYNIYRVYFFFIAQVVYILDQVRAMENEMLLRIQKQGLDVIPKILVVRHSIWSFGFHYV